MIYYWVPLIIAVVNCFIRNRDLNRVIVALCFVYMLLLSGFRDISVGTDTNTYVSRLFGARTMSSAEAEYLYVLLTNIFGNTFSSYTPYLFSLSFLFYVPILLLLLKECSNSIKYALLLFVISNNLFFIDSFNSIRQLIATSFLLISYGYMNKGKWGGFISYFFVAVGFHLSSLLYLPFAIVSRLNIKKKTIIIFLTIGIIFAVVGSFYSTGNILYALVSKLSFIGLDKYAEYVLYSDYSSGYNIVGMTKFVIIPTLYFIFILKEKEVSYYDKLYFWGLLLFCFLAPFITISRRGCMGLLAVELLVLPNAFVRSRGLRKTSGVLYFAIYVFFCAYSLIFEFADPDNMGPYLFVN